MYRLRIVRIARCAYLLPFANSVLLPIVKMEMWHNIHQDFGAPGGAGDPEPVTVVSCKHERRSKTYRYVFECESMFMRTVWDSTRH